MKAAVLLILSCIVLESNAQVKISNTMLRRHLKGALNASDSDGVIPKLMNGAGKVEPKGKNVPKNPKGQKGSKTKRPKSGKVDSKGPKLAKSVTQYPGTVYQWGNSTNVNNQKNPNEATSSNGYAGTVYQWGNGTNVASQNNNPGNAPSSSPASASSESTSSPTGSSQAVTQATFGN